MGDYLNTLTIIKSYMKNFKMEDLRKFAISKGIFLDEEELSFLFNFIKKNYEALYLNPNIDLSKYRNYFKGDNFDKIIELVNDAKIKYARFLN